jgi:hypothetical protein
MQHAQELSELRKCLKHMSYMLGYRAHVTTRREKIVFWVWPYWSFAYQRNSCIMTLDTSIADTALALLESVDSRVLYCTLLLTPASK